MASGLTHEAVIERLRQSGITRVQLRAGLQRFGYDGALADHYFDAIEGRSTPHPPNEPPFPLPDVLASLGVPELSDTVVRVPADSSRVEGMDPEPVRSQGTSPEGPTLFGLDLFRRLTNQFEAPTTGPVDPGYRLGPGDELTLVLTGDVESTYNADVTREGYVLIPDVGQVFVTGLTLEELRDELYYHLGQRFSGVQRGPAAPIQFHIGIRRLRSSVVYVIGEAQRPGAYQLSSVATVLEALYQAGGPSEGSSFRTISVRRGGEVVRTLDVYGYLLYGDTRDDIRLEHGDVVFLPVSGPRVTVEGAVRRPAIYEIQPTEGLATVLSYSGGLRSNAASHRIQIDRILPPEARKPGVDRVLVDVDMAALERGETVELRDGDVVRVFEIGTDRRNRVVVSGEVNRPGIYQWWEGLRLGDLVQRAEGFSEQVYTSRIHVFRLNPENGSRELIRVSSRDLDVPVADRDSVVVHSVSTLTNRGAVTIEGFVKEPGTYELARDMTLQDLILTAGGFTPGAYALEAELARLPDPTDGPSATPTIRRIAIGGEPDPGSPDVVRWGPSQAEVPLAHGDHVFVRKAPGYDELHTVHIGGEITFPGNYALQTKTETLSDLFRRAGGPRPEAYLPGGRLNRSGHLVATDMEAALAGGEADLTLMPGDSIHVPTYDPTVLVTGAVGFESRVRYEQGMGIDDFVDRAGGYAHNADQGRTTVTQQNGERRVVHLRRFFFDSKPEPGPGATIYVPARAESQRGIDWDRVLTRVLGVATAAATVILAVDRVGG